MGTSIVLLPFLHTTTTTMVNIKLTYFDLRAMGEPCRLLLAYGGLKYEDERIPPPWDPTSTWGTLKPSTPSCMSVISLTKVSSKASPRLATWWRELETFQTSRTGWRQDQSQTCKQSYQPNIHSL